MPYICHWPTFINRNPSQKMLVWHFSQDIFEHLNENIFRWLKFHKTNYECVPKTFSNIYGCAKYIFETRISFLLISFRFVFIWFYVYGFCLAFWKLHWPRSYIVFAFGDSRSLWNTLHSLSPFSVCILKMSIIMNSRFVFCVYIFQIRASVHPKRVCVRASVGDWGTRAPGWDRGSPWAIPCPSVASATRSGKRDRKFFAFFESKR